MLIQQMANRLSVATPVAAGGSSEVPLSLSLTTAGRVSFYEDYSELSAAGTHTFYVYRTHGTTGAVSVNYATDGDTHTAVSGTLNWADGEADIQSFTVEVTAGNLTTHDTAGLGEHRIVATLNTPTNGLVLHNLTHTRAYGVIDNSTMIASDANAWFVDYDAGADGTGTAASPFNSFASLRTNQNSNRKRYCYGKGTVVPSESVTGSILGLNIDAGGASFDGTSETDRTFIMAWPGFTWTISGGGGDTVAGFYADTNLSYVTFKNITVSNLSTAGLGSAPNACFAIWLRLQGIAPTWEHSVIDGIVSRASSNTGAIFDEGTSLGLKVWETTVSNVTKVGGGSQTGYEKYDGGSTSIQRCTFNDCQVYQKDSPDNGEVALCVRHCIFSGDILRLSGLAGMGREQGNYTIIQGNLFKPGAFDGEVIRFDGTALSVDSDGIKHWVVGNIVSDAGSTSSGNPAMYSINDHSQFTFFNNIWKDGHAHFRINDSGAVTGTDKIDYLDYNHGWNVGVSGGTRWTLEPSSYVDIAALQAGTAFEDNYTSGDPKFTNFATNDVTLLAGSPCIGSGLSGSDKGIFITGAEQLGAS